LDLCLHVFCYFCWVLVICFIGFFNG
jgi:hypothetical protein